MMNSKKWAAAWVAVCVSQLSVAEAIAGLPSVYRKIPTEIKNSNGYPLIAALDDQDPKKTATDTVYYYPANRREMEIGFHNFNQTVLDANGNRGGLCTSFDHVQSGISGLIETKNRLESEKSDEVKKLEADLIAAQKEVVRTCGPVDVLKKTIQQVDEDIKTQQSGLNLAVLDRANCLQTHSRATCDKIISDFQENIRKLSAQKEKHQAQLVQKEPACSSAERGLAFAQSNLDKERKDLDDITVKVNESLALLEKFGSIHGGNIGGTWDDGYQEAKKALEQENPGLRVMQLPRKQLNFYLGGAEGVGKVPFALGSTFSGQQDEILEKQPGKLDGSITPQDVDSDGANETGEDGMKYFSLLASTPFKITDGTQGGTSGAVSAQLSVPGACGVLAMVKSPNLNPGLVISSTSLFGNAAGLRVKASYNVWKIYEKIEESGKSSGFLGFGGRAWHDIWENQDEGESFKFEFYAEDPVDSAQEASIRQMLKKELGVRALASFAQMNHGSGTPPLPESGTKSYSVVAYSVLGWYGGVIVQVLDSFFGGVSSRENVKSTWNRTITEEWNTNRVMPMVVTHSVLLKMKK